MSLSEELDSNLDQANKAKLGRRRLTRTVLDLARKLEGAGTSTRRAAVGRGRVITGPPPGSEASAARGRACAPVTPGAKAAVH